jgi:hypothetical protein
MNRWQSGDYARLFFFPMLKTLVAMASNRLKIWLIDQVITQKVKIEIL